MTTTNESYPSNSLLCVFLFIKIPNRQNNKKMELKVTLPYQASGIKTEKEKLNRRRRVT
jgi:hypothetical protein